MIGPRILETTNEIVEASVFSRTFVLSRRSPVEGQHGPERLRSIVREQRRRATNS
jgi:hypothetical protein